MTKQKEKEYDVKDALGKKVNVGDIIMFIEQESSQRGYRKAEFGKAVVAKITDKSFKLLPCEVKDKSELPATDIVLHQDSVIEPTYKTSKRSIFSYIKTTFFVVDTCDGETLLKLL